VVSQALNLRSGPGTVYNRLGSLKAGDKLEIVGQYNGWLKVKTAEGKIGWVSGQPKYVSVSSLENVPPVPESEIPATPTPRPATPTPETSPAGIPKATAGWQREFASPHAEKHPVGWFGQMVYVAGPGSNQPLAYPTVGFVRVKEVGKVWHQNNYGQDSLIALLVVNNGTRDLKVSVVLRGISRQRMPAMNLSRFDDSQPSGNIIYQSDTPATLDMFKPGSVWGFGLDDYQAATGASPSQFWNGTGPGGDVNVNIMIPVIAP